MGVILTEDGGYLLSQDGGYLLDEAGLAAPVTDAAGAVDSISVVQTNVSPVLSDVAGATDEIHVVQYNLPPVPWQNPAQTLAPNPDFAVGGVPSIAGWQSVSAGAFAASSSPPAGCPQATAAQLSGTGISSQFRTASNVPMVQGIGYLLTTWVYSSVSSVYLQIDWLNSVGATVGNSLITYTIPVNTWVQLPIGVPGGSSIPATATQMLPVVGSATSGTWTLWATQVLLTAMASLYTPASPAYIKTGLPRMHVQNLVTGQWLHRDVQGITSPLVTWNLNNPDTFTCVLAPPRADLLDSTGNPLFAEWRDAVYLEQNDQINYGGILTNSTFNGPQWTITATGFAGYPTGMPYQGPSLTKYGYDALDAVRYIWAWLQSLPNGNIGMTLDATESGYLLGNNITNLASSTLARSASSGQPNVYVQLSDIGGFSAGSRITINTVGYQIKTIVTDTNSNPTGEITLTGNLAEAHSAGEEVLQVQTYDHLSKAASAGQATITVQHAAAFSNGEAILIGSAPYTIKTVATNTAGAPTGSISLTTSLNENHASGETVYAAPTPFQLLWYNSTDCGQEIQSIQQEAVFDWHETHAWTDATKSGVIHSLHFGVPRMGARRTDLRFAEGENIIQGVTVTRDGTQFADHVWGIGAGSGNSAIHTDSSELTGRISRGFAYTDQTVLTTALMAAKVSKVLAAMQNIDSPTTIVVKNHPNAPFGSFSCGDDIPVILATGWRNILIWCRITAMSQDPTTSLMTLTVARSDSFTYIAASGQDGTI